MKINELITESDNTDVVRVKFTTPALRDEITSKLRGKVDYAVYNSYVQFSKPKHRQLVDFLSDNNIINFNYDYAIY